MVTWKLILTGKYIIVGTCLIFSLLAVLIPRRIIRLFQLLCLALNWRVEPVNLKKEIFFLRLLGVSLAVLALMLTIALQ